MGNNTTVTKSVGFVAIASIIYACLEFWLPGLAEKLPRDAVTAAVVAIGGYFVHEDARLPRALGGIGAIMLALVVGGCTTTVSIPSWEQGNPITVASSILDRAPGSDQQFESRTLTGFGLRDLSFGIGSSKIARNPVASDELFAAGMRTATTAEALGQGLDDDMTLGDAFTPDDDDTSDTAP